jgi:hypothetical protein
MVHPESTEWQGGGGFFRLIGDCLVQGTVLYTRRPCFKQAACWLAEASVTVAPAPQKRPELESILGAVDTRKATLVLYFTAHNMNNTLCYQFSATEIVTKIFHVILYILKTFPAHSYTVSFERFSSGVSLPF